MYYSICISKALIAELDRDPAYSITVEIKLSTLKPTFENGNRKSDDKKRFSSCWDN